MPQSGPGRSMTRRDKGLKLSISVSPDSTDRLGTTCEVKRSKTPELPRRRISTSEIVRPSTQAQLVVLTGASAGRRYQVHSEALIGRDPACSIWIPDEGISRRHARVKRHRDGFCIEDAGSRNGTTVNGEEIEAQQLAVGDKISLGQETLLVFTHVNPLEEQMLQLQKMEAIGRLAAGVAHEFNNLLAVVLTNLTLLEDPEGLEPLDVRACLVEARLAAQRGSELTSQLLDFSRTSRSQKARTDLSGLVQEICQLLNRSLGPAVTIEADVEPDLSVNGDRLQLYQVLMNLCINAVDAIDKQGVIKLRAAMVWLEEAQAKALPGLQAGAHVELSVCDRGCGMDAETRRRAFEPFFSTKETGQGTGLGLSTVLGVARAHRGAVDLHSSPGAGTTVRVLLPSTPPTAATTGIFPAARPPDRFTETILVAEDDVLVARSVERTLRSQGFTVITAADGAEALRLYEQHRERVNLVILDLLMPVIDGQEALARLRSLDPDLPVLISSGLAEEEVVKRTLVGGARGFLSKPYDPRELVRTIAVALDYTDNADDTRP